MRVPYDEYVLDICDAVAARSTCPRLSVGAVIVMGRDIVATGYNGAPKGLDHCGCIIVDHHCIRSVHAEVNAILQATSRTPILGATLYTSHMPCIECCKVMINARIAGVVYRRDYVDARVAAWHVHSQAQLLAAAGLHVRMALGGPQMPNTAREGAGQSIHAGERSGPTA